jgi:hypothetical protein
MQTVYYSLMRKLLAPLLLVLPGMAVIAALFAQQPTSMRSSVLESHEGVTIGVDPWVQSTRYKEKFPKKSPFSGGVIALHVNFRNDTNEGIKVDLRRITLLLQLGDDNRQEISPLNADDVADTVLLKGVNKDPTTRRNPLPIPIGKTPAGRDKNWMEFRDACQNAAIPSSVIAAHGSVEGLLYFDVRGEWDLLQTARLYVPNLVTMGTNHGLLYFDIDLGHSSSN